MTTVGDRVVPTPRRPEEVGDTARPAPRRRRPRPSTALRLAGYQALMLAVVLALVVFGLYRAFAGQSRNATTRTLVAEARAYAAAAQARPAGQDLRAFSESYLRTHVLPDGEVLTVAIPHQGLIGSAGSGRLLATPLLQQWASTPPGGAVVRDQGVGEQDYRFVAVPMQAGDRTVGTIVAVADLSHATADQEHVLRLAAGEAAVALLVGVAGVYLLLQRLLRTVGRITDTAAGISQGDLDRRLGEQDGGDEVGRLAATFDQMTERLAAAMTAQRRLLSDVSHQLRTPLTVARGHLEVLSRTDADRPDEVRRTVAVVVDELDHMRSLVERLLMLGRSLEPDFLDPAPIDLRSLLADVLDAAQVLAPRQWQLAPVPDVVLVADPAKLRGALLNLVDNAVRATAPDDRVELLATQRADGSVVLAVDDSGPGIPPEQRSAVLTRFGRPGAVDSTGSGLGLAIVQAVALAHGGHVEVGVSRFGGARVAVVLPPSAVADGEAEPCSS